MSGRSRQACRTSKTSAIGVFARYANKSFSFARHVADGIGIVREVVASEPEGLRATARRRSTVVPSEGAYQIEIPNVIIGIEEIAKKA